MLRILFDPRLGFTPLVANPDVFFPASIRALRTEMHLFHDESWYNALISGLREDCSIFDKYWTIPDAQLPTSVAARPLAPLEVDLPCDGLVQFRIMAEPFVRDRRFRVIYCLPASAETMRKCAEWAQPT